MSARQGALLAALLAAAGIAGPAAAAGEAELLPVPAPSLEAMEAPIAEQLREARRRVEELAGRSGGAVPAADAERLALARAFGRLGSLYLLYELGDGARAALDNARRLEPGSFAWAYLLAAQLQRDSELEPAREVLAGALEIAPEDPLVRVAALVRLARIELDLDLLREAEAHFLAALAAAPGNAAALYGLGRLAYLEGDWPLAAERFEAVVAAQPDASTAHYQLGLTYREMGEREKARSHLARQGRQEVRLRDPLIESLSPLVRGSGVLVSEAGKARARGDLAGAVAAFRAAVAAGPDDLDTRLALASTLLQAGRLDEALEELQEVLARDPDNALAHYNLGTALAERGEMEAAIRHLRHTTEVAPDFTDARLNLATQLGAAGRLAEAEAQLSTLLDRDPTDDEARMLLAETRSRLGRHQEALDDLAELLRRRPDRGEVALARARALDRAGRAEEALEAYRQAAALPASGEARAAAEVALAEALVALERPEEALQVFERAFERVASPPRGALLTAARVLGGLGRYGDAADRFGQVLEREPLDREARFGRTLALLLAERYDEAARHLEESVRALPDMLALRHALARFLATCPDERLRDGTRAAELALDVVRAAPSLEHGETLAMAMAESGRFDEAAALQERLIAQARGSGAPAAAVERLERTLAGYRAGRPVRAPWRPGATP